MGLDTIELVMEVEDHFGIRILTEEFGQIRTVNDLVVVIQSRIVAAHAVSCPNVPAFRKLQTQVRQIKQDDRFRIRMRTRVVESLSPAEIRQLWTDLKELDDCSSLERLPWLQSLMAFTTLAAFAIALIAAVSTEVLLLPLTLVLAGFLTVMLFVPTERYRVVPPADLATFGAITRQIASATVATKRLHLKSREEILEELRPIVADVLSIKPAVIIPSARLIEDVGLS